MLEEPLPEVEPAEPDAPVPLELELPFLLFFAFFPLVVPAVSLAVPEPLPDIAAPEPLEPEPLPEPRCEPELAPEPEPEPLCELLLPEPLVLPEPVEPVWAGRTVAATAAITVVIRNFFMLPPWGCTCTRRH